MLKIGFIYKAFINIIVNVKKKKPKNIYNSHRNWKTTDPASGLNTLMNRVSRRQIISVYHMHSILSVFIMNVVLLLMLLLNLFKKILK